MFKFKTHTLYIRLLTNKVTIRSIEKDITIEREAVNPFSNQRMVLADFLNAEEFIRQIINEMYNHKRYIPSFKVIIQPIEKIEGGISPVEERSFNDLAMHIGAKYVFIHRTKEILDDSRVKEIVK